MNCNKYSTKDNQIALYENMYYRKKNVIVEDYNCYTNWTF